MKIIPGQSYPTLLVEQSDIAFCEEHAKKMCNGAKTYSFKSEKSQSLDVYTIGKIGELGMSFILNHAIGAGVVQSIDHRPFRDDYSKFNWDDDFIISLPNSSKQKIEVRTKARNVEPEHNFECCTDVIKPNLLYVFFSYNRNNKWLSLVGCADWEILSKHATVTVAGDQNNNFKHKVTEFNIKIEHLEKLKKILNKHCGIL